VKNDEDGPDDRTVLGFCIIFFPLSGAPTQR
jgi:hypothetical protein